MNPMVRNSPYAKKQPRKLSPAWRYAIIISVGTYSSTLIVSRIGIVRFYPHLVILDILVVGVGFLAGWIGVAVDEKRRERPLFDDPLGRGKRRASRMKVILRLPSRKETIEQE